MSRAPGLKGHRDRVYAVSNLPATLEQSGWLFVALKMVGFVFRALFYTHTNDAFPMLSLTRKTGESIFIGDDIEIVVTRIEYGAVRLAIMAPKEVRIFRGELYREMKRAEACRDKSGSNSGTLS